MEKRSPLIYSRKVCLKIKSLSINLNNIELQEGYADFYFKYYFSL